VVNIITKKAAPGLHARLGLEGGSFNTRIVNPQLTYAGSALSLALDYYKLATDGYSAAEPKKGTADYGKRGSDLGWEADFYQNETLSAKASYRLNSRNSLTLSQKVINSEFQYDPAAGTDGTSSWGSPTYNAITNRFTKVAYDYGREGFEMQAGYAESSFERTQYGGYGGAHKEADLHARIGYAGEDFLLIGANTQTFSQETSAGSKMDEAFTSNALYAANTNLFGALSVTETLRSDHYDAFDDKITGKLGLKYSFAKNAFLSANAGGGYNVPTIYQLYDPWSGNEALKAEETRSYDISAAYGGVKLTYFYNTIDNMIDYDYTAWKYITVDGTSTIRGYEAEVTREFAELNLVSALGYTRLQTEDANGVELERRPDATVTFALDWYASEALHLGLSGKRVGKRYDDKARTVEMKPYTVADLVANYAFSDTFSGYVKLNNLTDEYYQVVDGYATEVRSLYAGIKAAF
jgi:vitamin B12 transporter